uniref:Uncharacterized protein n=1 Tax=viral metagenome TaxID=1070528 RepID=A0A6C0HGZ9_9ZZZZ
MEKTINKKIETHQIDFKNQIKTWFETHKACIKTIDVNGSNINNTDTDLKSEFLQFVFDSPSIAFDTEDFQKRKRIKNIVASDNLCIAKRANGQQCTRSKKHESGDFCGTHIKGTPHGEINTKSDEKGKTMTKIEIWVQEIKGINYYIDSTNNVYKPEDIISNKQNPSIIAKWSLSETGVYKIPSFGI